MREKGGLQGPPLPLRASSESSLEGRGDLEGRGALAWDARFSG